MAQSSRQCRLATAAGGPCNFRRLPRALDHLGFLNPPEPRFVCLSCSCPRGDTLLVQAPSADAERLVADFGFTRVEEKSLGTIAPVQCGGNPWQQVTGAGERSEVENVVAWAGAAGAAPLSIVGFVYRAEPTFQCLACSCARGDLLVTGGKTAGASEALSRLGFVDVYRPWSAGDPITPPDGRRGKIAAMADELPEWEQLLAAERHLQAVLPAAVLVGGTAAALHAGHRTSLDGDHVLEDLRDRFDEVVATLEHAAGWQTERLRRPVLILDQMDGVLTGIRQLRRTRPLETEMVSGLRVPTLAEMARIKAWLLATRHTVRDYLDCVVLLERLGESGARSALAPFDEIYRQPSGASPLAEVAERLVAALPADRARVDLSTYRGLAPPWNGWDHLGARGRHWGVLIARLVLEGA